MNVINQYITFLKEYKKLLERGVKDVLSKNVAPNFIWIDDVKDLVDSKICYTNLIEIFSENFKKQSMQKYLIVKMLILEIPHTIFYQYLEMSELVLA